MAFINELAFEKELISVLTQFNWDKNVIYNPTEEQLIQNWANILFDNNRHIDRLNDQPLTKTEMQQVMDQVNTLRTPVRLNGFINGKTVSIKRDNPNDPDHLHKEISLKIYDRDEISAGQSTYQIVSQPIFKTRGLHNNRRGDIMLLINGMPVIHIELKASGVPVIQAANQIEKYSREGAFRGIYSLVQIFVAMNPENTLYFANPGEDNKFNSNYYFQWADFNNTPITNWKDIVSSLLLIPMAHELIGYYTVADNSDGLLKVLRSYQYHAAYKISDKVSRIKDWDAKDNMGGYIWHTTGSGKTMTSFKSAQLIASSKDADKVVFLVDRIELGTQSLREYKNFASDYEDVQATENTNVLISKLKSKDPKDTLIVTSIQKMSNISHESRRLSVKDIELMNSKRVVFIIDEAHRSTFGEMLYTIKKTFPKAVLFGFTGTPIEEENQRKDSTTKDVFGDELHRYSIADGIRDKNVLGFDTYKVLTYKDADLRKVVALSEAKAKDEYEAITDPVKKSKYYEFINDRPMATTTNDEGKTVKGIEDYIPNSQYNDEKHHLMVVKNIKEHWLTLSQNSKFHAILATSSIKEAIKYYRLFKKEANNLKVVGLFDPSIDNSGGTEFKSSGLIELLEDYNERYEQSFDLGNWARYKKDVAARLAHKAAYIGIERTPEKQIDILIVVDQMLTGYDSKWLNTLYVDKLLKHEHVIQAFSRTNRLFGPDKPFGTIKYYRKPHTMEQNIQAAINMYSGNRPYGMFVPKLEENINNMNHTYKGINNLFENNGKNDFTKLPEDIPSKAKFAKSFREFSSYYEAAKIQGFTWEDLETNNLVLKEDLEPNFNENGYLTLALRYKELSKSNNIQSGEDVPYEIDSYLAEIDTGMIDTNYMNLNFTKYLKALNLGDEVDVKRTLKELHSSFALLSQEEQKYASIFLRDIQSGDVTVEANKTLRDYITLYQVKAKEDQINRFATLLGMDETKLRNIMSLKVTINNINEFGRLDMLIKSVNFKNARNYFEKIEGTKLSPPKVHMMIDNLIRRFILESGFEI